MNAAVDLHANQPTPYIGRAAPPEAIKADNDDAVSKARARRQEAIKVKPSGKGRHKRLARATGINGPERAMHKANEARKCRNKATVLANVDPKGNKAKIDQHLATAKRLEAEAKAIMDEFNQQQWAGAANAETYNLAIDRGELATRDIHGRVIVSSRCGLTLAYENGNLARDGVRSCEDELFAVGRRYRDAFEISTGMTSSRGEGGSGVKGPQIRKLEAGYDLKMLRTGLSAQQLRALDFICGLSQTIFAYANAGSIEFDEAQKQLVQGLDTAALNARASKAAKDTADRMSAADLARASASIAKAERSIA